MAFMQSAKNNSSTCIPHSFVNFFIVVLYKIAHVILFTGSVRKNRPNKIAGSRVYRFGYGTARRRRGRRAGGSLRGSRLPGDKATGILIVIEMKYEQ